MMRNLAVGLVVVVVVAAGLMLAGGRFHVKLGGHEIGLKHAGHAGHAGHGRHGGKERTISVVGRGTVVVAPDRALISIAVSSFGTEASEALTVNNTKMTRIINGLATLGIERKEIQTTDFNLRRRTDRDEMKPGNEEGLIGYTVRNEINVRTDKVEMVGEILDKVIGWGATEIDDLSFSVSDSGAYSAGARTLAIENAKILATEVAEAAGVELGAIISVRVGTRRRRTVGIGELDLIALDSTDVSLFAAPEYITATVDVVFGIR